MHAGDELSDIKNACRETRSTVATAPPAPLTATPPAHASVCGHSANVADDCGEDYVGIIARL
jgi:hypothetical protein